MPISVTGDRRKFTTTAAGLHFVDALINVFRAHNRSLELYLRGRIGNEQDAEDIAQEAYARLLQLDRVEGVGYLRAYLFKTATHIAIDRARQGRVRKRIDFTFAEQQGSETPGPERFLSAAEELRLVAQALAELPWKYRHAFVLRRYEGWAPEQIAQELGTQLRMVRNYISRSTRYCKLRAEGIVPEEARQLSKLPCSALRVALSGSGLGARF